MLLFLALIDSDDEKELFGRVYNLYKGLMYLQAFQILRNAEDAEDAVQEAFFSLTKNISKISDPECPKTKSFMVIIVRRKALNILKKRHPDAEFIDEINCESETKDEHDLDSLLERCIYKLPDKYRNVLLLKYHFGYSLKEISEMMNISLSNAQKIDQRAKAKLKEIARDEGYDI